jgi:hypothetical protein
MAQLVLDVVAVLPAAQRTHAVALSAALDRTMRATGDRSFFRLGEPYPGGGQPCEPHVSILMLSVAEEDLDAVLAAVGALARDHPALAATGMCYRHNPHGAAELYYHKTPRWIDLQRSVIEAVEPLRRGRLREVDPAGARISELMADPEQDAARREQLARFGYDEVTWSWSDLGSPRDRFNPHITLAWPTDPAHRVPLHDLPPAETFSAELGRLAVYGMSPQGTCTVPFGTAALGRANRPGGVHPEPVFGYK